MEHIDQRLFRLLRHLALIAALVGVPYLFEIANASSAVADDTTVDAQLKTILSKLQTQEKQLLDQERRLKKQQDDLASQAATIARQREELTQLQSKSSGPQAVNTAGTSADASKVSPSPKPIQIIDAAGPTAPIRPVPQRVSSDIPQPAEEKPNFLMPLQYNQTAQLPTDNTAPASPVGVAPDRAQEQAATQAQADQVVQSLPVGLAVLTPTQHFIFTPSLEYTQTTNDQLVFEGVVIVPGINLGEVTATTDDRSIFSSVFDVRYGVTNHIEVEARVPFTFSDDRATVLSQGPNSSATQSMYISGKGIGDVQVAARYQINDGLDDWPVFVANVIAKSDTGTGPFDVARNSAGIAEAVPVGSGFWALQGGFSVLKVSDPAILYASANYIYQIPKTINQTIGGVFVGNVDPSNAVSAAFGFGFAINPTLSFSLGYEHSYVFPQVTELGGTQQSTTSLEVGALTFGMAYRLAPNMSLNSNFEFGVTHDAPNMRVVFSLPISY